MSPGTYTGPSIRIQPTQGWSFVRLYEIWQFRELLYFLVWRNVKVRYKQTVLGVLWVVVQPLVLMVVFSLFFGRLVGIATGHIPYPLFVLSALIPWQFVTKAVAESTMSLVAEQRLLTKVYFPRIIIPLACVGSALLDLAVSSILLALLCLFYGIPLGPHLVFVPAFLLFLIMTTLGVSFWLAALNVKFRDIMHTLPFLVQFWMFITPIVYPSSVVPEAWRTLYSLNPLVGILEGFRWALLGGVAPLQPAVVSVTMALFLFITGLIFFRSSERRFAEVLGGGG